MSIVTSSLLWHQACCGIKLVVAVPGDVDAPAGGVSAAPPAVPGIVPEAVLAGDAPEDTP